MSKENLSNGKSLEAMEMGTKPEEAEDTQKLESEATNHLLEDYPPDEEKVPLPTEKDEEEEEIRKTVEKVKKRRKSSQKADPLPGMFGGVADVVYDDEDWQSDMEDEDDEDKKSKEEKEKAATSNKMDILSKIVFWIQGRVADVNNMAMRLTKGYFWTLVWLVAYFCYFIVAMEHSFGDEASRRLLVCTILGVLIYTRNYLLSFTKMAFRWANGSDKLSAKQKFAWDKFKFGLQWTLNLGLLGVMIYVMVDEGRQDIENLRALLGLFFFLLACLLFSNNPGKIDWYLIYWAMGLQFLLALLALKGKWGRDGVLWVQERLDEFFANAKEGSKLVFGESYQDHYMVFAALPLMFVTNATLVVLYYLGAMQVFTKFLGSCLNLILHTSPVECISVAGGIFLEGGIMAFMLRPFLGTLSKSEMFVFITSGLASLGGTYVAILAAYGVSLEYVIPAMLVSAPATFAVCKLMVPETLERKRKNAGRDVDWDVGNMERERYSSAIDALQGGAASILGLLGNVVAVAFVFFSYINWINSTLEWFGDRVGIDELSIELIFSYLLYPVSMAMGVEIDDCRRVAMLLGYRIGSTNIIAFFKMADMKVNKIVYNQYMEATNFTGPVSTYRDDITLDLWNKTLTNGFLTDRSEAIITYCLCGFSSALSLGIFMSFMYVLVPRRRASLGKMTFRALIAGNVANCMTGCFASIFY